MDAVRKGTLTIQAWSSWLVVSCLLPAIVASALLILLSYQRERTSVERSTIGTARALMQAVDRELASAQGELVTLAASPPLAAGNLPGFEAQARRAVGRRPGDSIVLLDAQGQTLIDTRRPHTAPRPPVGGPPARPPLGAQLAVSDLYRDPASGRFLVSVSLPVRHRHGHYELFLQLSPEHVARILSQQQFPPAQFASVFDGAGVIVARTRSADRFLGQRGVPALLQGLAETSEGTVKATSLDGIPVVAAFSRSALSGWAVAIGIPVAEFHLGLWKSVSLLVLGAVLLLLAALLLARYAASRITGSIRALVQPATALGHGEPVRIPPLDLREAEDVRQALMRTAVLLRERTAQRDAAERAERELMHVKQQLEEGEALQRGIFEEGPDAILLIAASGRVVRANREAARIFERPLGELLGLTVEDLVPPEARQRHAALREAFLANPQRRPMGEGAALSGVRADGSRFPIDVMLSPLRAGGEGLVIATVRDVTERWRSEEALRASEKRFRSTLEHAPIGMAIISLEGRWIEVNNAICDIVGYRKDELEALTETDITHPDDLADSSVNLAQLVDGKVRSYQIEKRFIRKDGATVPVLVTESLLRDDAGQPLHLIAQVQDITARKQAEQQLFTLHNRLTLATQAGGIGVWEQDLVAQAGWCDKRMRQLYGLPDEDGRADDTWWQRIHPEHAARVRGEFEAAVRADGLFATEYPIVWPTGELRIVRTHAVLSRDATGQPVRMTGISWDVTESRQKEAAIGAALREKETLLKELYHRVKNNLQVVTSLFNLQVRTLPEGPAREALREGAGRVRAMALVHEKLYQSGNLTSISLDEYVADLCVQLGSAIDAEQRGVRFIFDTEPMLAGLESAVPLGLVLNELICNSLKHAFPEARPGLVTIALHRLDPRRAELVVADNGVGFASGLLPAGGATPALRTLGLKLVAALTAQIDGRLALQNAGGARVSIVFPIAPTTTERRGVLAPAPQGLPAWSASVV